MKMDDMRRYERQIVLDEIGMAGQERLARSRVVVVGLGALGGHIALHLARAGVGYLRLIDRDIVEVENLQRQVLYEEEDVRAGLPKATAAANHLAHINSSIKIEHHVADLTPKTAEKLLSECDLIADGTDNLETRLLINDFCLKNRIPWVYGAVLATSGLVAPIIPQKSACLRCMLSQIPVPGTLPTCQTHGVLNTAPALIAALQTTLAYRILLGEDVKPTLLFVDLWNDTFQRVEVPRRRDCPACARGEFEYLEGKALPKAFSLCGRDAVQINPAEGGRVSLEAVKRRLGARIPFQDTGYFVRFRAEGYEFVVFADGRILVKGTDDPSVARGLVSRYIGL